MRMRGRDRTGRNAVSRRALLAGGASLVALGVSAPFGVLARPLDDVRAGTLIVVVYEDNAPFSFANGGALAGIDVDVARAVAQALGVPLNLVGRKAGEQVDDDLRVNVWRGPVTGGPLGDVMLHVPVDRELARRNTLTVIANPYFRHTLAFAVDARTEEADVDYELFTRETIALELDTMTDFYLLTAFGGQARQNILHCPTFEEAAAAFRAGKVRAVAGTRAQLEHALAPLGPGVRILAPPLGPGFRQNWIVGSAVKENSRDLSYALGDALRALRESGTLAEICHRYGVTYDDPNV